MFNFYKKELSTNRRIIISGVIGNLLESFDVMICVYLAHSIATTFFPPNQISKNFYYIFIVFFIGYISRPLGSIFIGLFADQFGRKKILVYSILITGICTAIIGIIPSFQTIGYFATVLFIIFRIMQNISVGGEYISSISYLIESADKNKRGYYGSWVSVGFNGGTLLASLSVYLLTYSITNHYIPEWSWRGLFFIALAGTFIGVWIRGSLPESLGYVLSNSSAKENGKSEILKSTISLIKAQPLHCLAIIAIAWLGVSETSAIFVYSPIHMTTVNHFSQQDALEINTLSLILLTVLIPLFGNLYDRCNKIKLLSFATISFVIFSPIYFHYLTYGSYWQVLLAKLIFSIPSACYYALATVLITETFPVNIRCTSLALIYQSTSALAGGLTPIILLSLAGDKYFGSYPAIPIIISGSICLIGLSYLRSMNQASNVSDTNGRLSFQNVT